VVYGLEVFSAVTDVPALSCWISAFATSSTEIALMHSVVCGVSAFPLHIFVPAG
jgi:hypothetical protein